MNVPDETLFDVNLLSPSMTEVDTDEYDFASHDIHATMIGMVPVLVERARNAVKNGQSFSYRGFLVGASAVAYDADPESARIGIYTAGNYKAKLREEERDETDLEDIPKICAEMDINLQASADDFERIGIFVVAATSNPDKIAGVTDLAGPTLEPCDECESVMRHSDLVDGQTIIMTVGSGKDVYQVQNFANLSRRYHILRGGTIPKPLPKYTYSSYAWEDRRSQYVEHRDSKGLGSSIYDRKKREEKQCRDLALEVMTA